VILFCFKKANFHWYHYDYRCPRNHSGCGFQYSGKKGIIVLFGGGADLRRVILPGFILMMVTGLIAVIIV